MQSKPRTIKQSDKLLVSGYIRCIYHSTTTPIELILICVSFTESEGKEFIYSSDFDKNGICYGLATDFGRTQWLNPMKKGLINVTAEWHLGSHCNPYILKRKPIPCACYTRNNKNGIIEIDFKSQLIVPTAYSWRHDVSNSDYPLNWNFEASINGTKWYILKKHKNDFNHGIHTKFACHTWMIQPLSSLISYRMFRYRITGINDTSNINYPYQIHSSGFEIYGKLINITKQHKEEYEQIIIDRENELKEKERKEKRSQERRRKCVPIGNILLIIIVMIFIFVPDIAAFIIGIKEYDNCGNVFVGVIGANLYLIIGSIIHFVGIIICIVGLWIVLERADTDNYWDDEILQYKIMSSVCCFGIWIVIWSIIGCILYLQMKAMDHKNDGCRDIIISWAVLKILESIGMPFVLYMWAVFMGFTTYDYE